MVAAAAAAGSRGGRRPPAPGPGGVPVLSLTPLAAITGSWQPETVGPPPGDHPSGRPPDRAGGPVRSHSDAGGGGGPAAAAAPLRQAAAATTPWQPGRILPLSEACLT
jgi:hypothetical protein